MARSRRDKTAEARPELLELLRRLSYREGRVVLASGKESDFFIDCKQTVLTARGHQLVAELILDGTRHLHDVHAVAGVALGGCPLASAVSLMSMLRGRPMDALYVRKEAKDHGSRRLIEGPVRSGMRVILLEDVITTGGSTLHAIEVLRGAGVEVVAVAVLVDRLEGGVEAVRAAGVEVVTLYTRHDFISDEDEELYATVADTTF
jgi:orotate phosphoribosyltransferase